MFDLEAHPLTLRQPLVIRDFQDDARDLLAKNCGQLLRRRFRVFDRVVQDRGLERNGIFNAAHLREQARDPDRVIDVGRCFRAFPPLVPMLHGGEVEGLEQSEQGRRVPVHWLAPMSAAFANSGNRPRHMSRKLGSLAKPITRPRPTRSVHNHGVSANRSGTSGHR